MGSMQTSKIRLVICAVVLLAGGCADQKFIGRPDLKFVGDSVLPAPATIDLITKERPYVIGPLDQLSVDVYGAPELNRAVQVDASGRISMPLVGTIEASGKTPLALSQMIQDRLRGKYLRDPQVTVNLTETVSQVFTVDGEVRAPGPYPVIGRMTLMRAVARAQGTTEFSKDSHVVIFRRVDDKDMAGLYDLASIRAGMYADPEVFANDVILVGDSRSRRIFKDVLQASGLIAAPLIAVLQ
ncbi:MAG: polysaccharide export protein [Sphingomonadales bacterium]|nr:MAG: polysaccharide export protein [Sphingomonadales bacterium]